MPKGDMSTRDPIDRAAGAGTIIRDVDGMLFITKKASKTPQKSKEFTTHWEFRNHPCVEPFGITWSYPAYQRQDGPEGIVEQTDTALTPAQLSVLALLSPDPLPYAEWRSRAEPIGIRGGSFSRIVGVLEQRGYVIMEKSVWKSIDRGSKPH
jgi:hypothetical protein